MKKNDPTIQCLVTTFNLKKNEVISLAYEMNVFCDTIIRNQCGYNGIEKYEINGKNVLVIYSDDIGTSKNRNELLKMATSDYVIFADDDEFFNNGIKVQITNEIVRLKKPYSIAFNVRVQNENRKVREYHRKTKRCKMHDVSQSGVWRFVIKTEIARSICFDENLGPGTNMVCGEDSIFIHELLKKRRAYICNVDLGIVYQTNSTWFGKIPKTDYLYNKGYVYDRIYGKLAILAIFRFLFRTKQLSFKNLKICLKGTQKSRMSKDSPSKQA